MKTEYKAFILTLAIFIVILGVIKQANALDIDKINNLAFTISTAKEYKLDIYDCTQYSKDLKVQLRKEGFNAICITGRMKVKGIWIEHNWVLIKDINIFVEATPDDIGIIPEQYYNLFYKEIERGVCR